MLRHTLTSRAHLFAALVPTASRINDPFLSPEQLEVAKKAIAEREDILGDTDLAKALEDLQSIRDARHRRDLIQRFANAVDAFRAELYKRKTADANHRLQLHEAIMAAGFYQRAVAVNELTGESLRFVLNHYNFDVRRDTSITKRVHDSLHADKEATPESDKLLRDLLVLERRLSGKYRLAPTGGRRWLVLGQPLSELSTKEELQRVLGLEPLKAEGNFTVVEAEADKLWYTLSVSANDEPQTSFLEDAGLHTAIRDADRQFELRVEKPKKPLDFWEKLSETLMRYWVLWFSLWVMFFLVDEEIITLVALIFLKYRQTAIMEKEAEKTGGKVYVASSTGRLS